MSTSPRRSNAVLAAFSGPCLPLAAFGVALPVTLPEYYATHVGLELGVVAAVFMAVRLIDIGFDPLIGWAMDRTRTPMGRYRPWMVASAPILMLAALMMFVMAKPGDSPAYLFGWLLFLYLGFSMGTLGQMGWAAVLAPEYNQRSRVYGFWQFFNIIGVILILVLPTIVVRGGFGTYADGVKWMGWGIIIALPITLAIAYFAAPEPQLAPPKPHGGIRTWLGLFKLKTVRKLLLADLFLGVAPGITGSLVFFFFGQVKGYDHASASIFMLLYFMAGLVGAPFWAWLATRIGKHKTLAVSSIIFAVFYGLACLVPGGNFAITAAAMFMAGLPYAAALFLLRAMMADAGDEVRHETGEDLTGLMFSILAVTTKMGHVVALIPYAILQFVGFKPLQTPAENGDLAILMLQILFIAVPAALMAAAALVMRNYPLTAQRHDQIRAELALKDAKAAL
ncbi:MFS transporter [Brevundimonas sp.]|uniref:MFS transporter n=5 Tax=Brevundimonas sp. TaxID=1871086 RepID=UPI002FC83E7C